MATATLKHLTVVVIFTINSCLIINDNFYISATGLPTLHPYSDSRTRVFQKTDKNNLKGKTTNNGKVKKSEPFFCPLFRFDPKHLCHNTPTIKISLACR